MHNIYSVYYTLMHYFYIFIYISIKCNNIYKKSYLFTISMQFIYENFKLYLHKIIIIANSVHYNSNYFCYNTLFYFIFCTLYS